MNIKIAITHTNDVWDTLMPSEILFRAKVYADSLNKRFKNIELKFDYYSTNASVLKTATVVPHRENSKNVKIIDHAWFEKNIACGKPYAATVLLLNKKQAKEMGIKNATGCHYRDNDGHGDIWIVADEKATVRRKEGIKRRIVPRFEELLDHELKHFFCHRYNIRDTVHDDNFAGFPDAVWGLVNDALDMFDIPELINPTIDIPWTPWTNSEKILNVAQLNIGFDVTPQDYVPDEVACAETVNALVQQALGTPIGGGASTYLMYAALASSPLWKAVESPQAGDIVISPTGHGNAKVMPHGHVGIMLSTTAIGSNDSRTGKFESNFTVDSWNARYKARGGYPVFFFRRK